MMKFHSSLVALSAYIQSRPAYGFMLALLVAAFLTLMVGCTVRQLHKPYPLPPAPVISIETTPFRPTALQPALAEADLLDIAIPAFEEIAATPMRKQAFIAYITQLAEVENATLTQRRAHLHQLYTQKHLEGRVTPQDALWLTQLSDHYHVKYDPELSTRLWSNLFARVDEVPVSLVVAQAAMESAWGGSRFAREGHNYFGQWCYRAGCGLVPKKRSAGKTHEVQAFVSPQESVRSYMQNLNRNRAYKELRRLRYQAQLAGKKPQGSKLAMGLKRYSAKGMSYVRNIQALIRDNGLENTENTAL